MKAQTKDGFPRHFVCESQSVPVKRLLLTLAVALASLPLIAVDYQNLGSVTAEGGWVWDIDDASYYSFLVTNEMSHSLELEAARVTARTLVFLPGLEESLLHSAGVGGTYLHDVAIGQAEIRVPEASLAFYPTDWFTVRAGWFDLDWGTGYVFDPGNVLGATAANEFTGRTASGPASISGFSLTFVPSYQLTFGIAGSLYPDPAVTRDADPWKDTAWAVWANGFVGPVDLFAGLQASPDRFLRPSVGLSTDVAGVIVGAEAALEFDDPFRYPASSGAFETRQGPHFLATGFASWQHAGRNATFGATGEYLYTGLGYERIEAQRLYDAIAVLDGASAVSGLDGGFASLPTSADGVGVPPLGQHYVISELSFSRSDSFETSAATLVNLSDGSHLINGRLTLLTIAAVDLFLEGLYLGGDEGQAEYSLAGSMFLLRVGAKVVW